MNQKLWMGVSARAAAAAVVWLLAVPPPVAAAPILTSNVGDPCAMVTGPGSSSCALFSLDPFSPVIEGSFGSDDDIALMQFTLAGSTIFSASAAAGFDAFFGLFYGDGPDAGRVVLIPDGAGGFYRALSAETLGNDGALVDSLPDPGVQAGLLLGSGTYLLALLQLPNEFQTATFDVGDTGPQELEYLPAGFGLNGIGVIGGGCDPSDEARCAFSLSLSATPVDPAPVPEPGTLSLLAVGTAAGAWMRRKRTRARRPRSS